MSPRQAIRWLVLMFILVTVFISYQGTKELGYPPPPGRYVAAVGLYGLFGAIAEFAPGFASALGMAYTVGLLVAPSSRIRETLTERTSP